MEIIKVRYTFRHKGSGNIEMKWYSIGQLEERAKCRLSIRLTNKKSEMALNGSPKSKIDKVNKMDVFGDDARLTEIYLAIVKEMAIKYGVGEVS